MDVEAADAEWTAHFVAALGIEVWHEADRTLGRAELRPEMWTPGTEVPRLGVLATMADLVGGIRPSGPINPTVDLRVTLLSRPPAGGTVLLVCHPVKVGRRLFVGEVILHTGDAHQPFARSTVTFMNQGMGETPITFGPRPREPIGAPSFDDLLRPRVTAPGVVEMDAHASVSNGPGGTIQGGAQALLAEIAAEGMLAPRGRYHAVDLEIRYLNRVKGETVTAVAEVIDGDLGDVCVRVPINDSDAGGRVVSLVSVICREL
ncbi:MAG: PaaI family thioesterase [Acidimicrobiia bacterium]